jgi:hypothetical protein
MKWIFAVIATEAIVEILVHSDLFLWLRRLLPKLGLFDCGWCLSVWIGAGIFALTLTEFWWLTIPIVIHRTSNYLHDAYGLLRR